MEARKMVVRGSVRAHQAAVDEAISTVRLILLLAILSNKSMQNMRELRNELGQTFGTKKAKKAIASVTENAIGPKTSRLVANGAVPAKLDLASAAVIASMAEATEGMSTREQLAAQADAAKPRPKANMAATDIKDVYTVDSLIGLDIFKIVPVIDWQTSIDNKEPVTGLHSRYVAERIEKVAAAGGVQKLKILRYLLCLLDLHRSLKPTRGGRLLPKKEDMRAAFGNVPNAVIEDIRRKFSDAGTMSKYQVDLLITHICALACLVDNYEVDFYDLKSDLKLENKQISQYFKEVGAKIAALPEALRKKLDLDKAAAAQRKVAKLKLPLDFPKVAFGRKGR